VGARSRARRGAESSGSPAGAPFQSRPVPNGPAALALLAGCRLSVSGVCDSARAPDTRARRIAATALTAFAGAGPRRPHPSSTATSTRAVSEGGTRSAPPTQPATPTQLFSIAAGAGALAVAYKSAAVLKGSGAAVKAGIGLAAGGGAVAAAGSKG